MGLAVPSKAKDVGRHPMGARCRPTAEIFAYNLIKFVTIVNLWYTACMKLPAKVKLQPSEAQVNSLKRTLETANAACDYISQVAWDTHTFGKFQVQKLVYEDVRATFDLTAQLVIRCISKVTDAYKF